MKTFTRVLVLVLEALIFSACAGMKPAVVTHFISSTSLDEAFRAATRAARNTDWIVKTIDKGNGYIYAEKERIVIGGSGKSYIHKLEVDIVSSSSGEIEFTVKVTPPPGIMGTKSPQDRASEFLIAFEKYSK